MKKIQQDCLVLDGAHGEGGGQVLRSALALAMITGQPFKIESIRAKRNKPGLLRQHLTAVQAAAKICGAQINGAELGSQSLHFRPGPIVGGDYQFAIGTAGSCTLVLQTVLPALWFAKTPSTVTVKGGTHNKAAPPADFLIRAWAPLIAKMGVEQSIELHRHGFYPAGGGEIRAEVKGGANLQPLTVSSKGKCQAMRAEARVAGVSGSVAQRELARITGKIAYVDTKIKELPRSEGPGNVVMIEVIHDEVTELFTGFGEKGISAESVADHVAKEARNYLNSPAAVGEHMADQLLLPLALAGGGQFTTTTISSHLETNIEVIKKFLAVNIKLERISDALVLVSIE